MVKKAQLLEDATDLTNRIKGRMVKKEQTSEAPSKPINGKKRPLSITDGPGQERKPKVFAPTAPNKPRCKHYDKLGHTAEECLRKIGTCLRCGQPDLDTPSDLSGRARDDISADIQTYPEMVKKAQLLEDVTDLTDRIKRRMVKKKQTAGAPSKPTNGRVGQNRLPECDASACRIQNVMGSFVAISPENAAYQAVAFSSPVLESEQEKDRPWIAGYNLKNKGWSLVQPSLHKFPFSLASSPRPANPSNISEPTFEGALKAFYLSLQITAEGSITGSVKGTSVTISEDLLVERLECLNSGHKISEAVSIEKQKLGVIGNLGSITKKGLLVNELSAEKRLLHSIITNIITPRAGAYSVDATCQAVAFWFPGLQGGVIMELGARRRWPFRREGPNGSALLLEVGTLDSSHPSMLSSPLRLWFLVVWGCGSVRIMLAFPTCLACSPPPLDMFCIGFGVVSGRIVPEPPSAEGETAIEPAVWWSRLTGSTEFPTVVFSVPLLVSRFASTLPFVGETSQQWQGMHRVEETGR
ncbi:hypothetical protein Taro_005359 [Colocasia esculenta]|uniref:Uncharacterized protein n=1 Tax=Colocasia esculenta TaxID=4460 RepID=A0A843TMV2_COLES|nr:hypothetical protein [Colocasia esculenta]